MKYSAKSALRILELDPNAQENISLYIRQLRTCLQTVLMENIIYRQEATLPDIGDINPFFKYSPIEDHWWFSFGDKDSEAQPFLFITLTFDPRKFPQLIVCPHEEQKKYIEQVLTKSIEENIIKHFYGVYELQANGNIHFHFITSLYDTKENEKQIKQWFSKWFTDRKENKYSVDVKRVHDLNGLLNDYLKKDPQGHVHNLEIIEKKSIDFF